MESVGKIINAALCSIILSSCATTYTPIVLAEIKPQKDDVVEVKKVEYEAIYSILKVLEVSEENGVQKYLFAKIDRDSTEIAVGVAGEISADATFETVIGTMKIISKSGGFVRCSIESLNCKIPANSFVRIEIGKKAKEASE